MNEFEVKLAALREQFVRNASGKLEILDVSIARLAEDRADRVMLDRAMRAFHSFGGVGTTYGLPEVTRAGRAAEKICDQVVAEERPITDPEIAALRSELHAIALAIDPSGEGVHADESSPRRILLIDEDPEEASFIRMVLETVGYDVRVCEDSRYLDADLRSFAPELVLATERFALSAGARFATALECTEYPLIVISDGVNEESAHETSLGAKLRRPLTPSLLISTVTTCLQADRQTGR